MKKKILVSTGGSGGHVIPATIIYEHLKNEFDVLLTIDKRGMKFINLQKYNFTIIDTPKITKNFLKLPAIFFCFILVLSIGLVEALFLSPEDYLQKDSVRIMYVHVPAAWISLGIFSLIAILSVEEPVVFLMW